jgi:hypothetical protein
MENTPFAFAWPVDQAGYEIFRNHVDQETAALLGKDAVEFVVPRGGLERFYRPLDDEGLWLRFAQTCKDTDGILSFSNDFGLLGEGLGFEGGLDDVLEAQRAGGMFQTARVDHILRTAVYIKRIWEYLKDGDRQEALELFNQNLPMMKAAILQYNDEPERFNYKLIPLTLRDALLYQAGEAITGNRRFRQCKNEGCPNWFRLGPNIAEGGHRQTITARREFCSDRCRVASARRQKKEGVAHA